jgi:DNA-binding transcriptional LysR family regulator
LNWKPALPSSTALVGAPRGRRLLEQARAVLKERNALTALASELRSGWEPELRVVVDGALSLAPVIRAIRAFAEPEVPTFLRLDVEYQEGVLHRFEQGAELALVLGFEGGGGEVHPSRRTGAAAGGSQRPPNR